MRQIQTHFPESSFGSNGTLTYRPNSSFVGRCSVVNNGSRPLGAECWKRSSSNSWTRSTSAIKPTPPLFSSTTLVAFSELVFQVTK